MNENRRTFIKNMALAGGCAFISLSPTKLFGEEGEKRIAPIERVYDTSLNYQQTIKILKKAYMREIYTHLAYTKFSQKALEEDYPNIAYLFKSFAVAESIHGRNFRNTLVSFGIQSSIPAEKYKALSTKKNLGQAINLELQEINIYYPEHIRAIKEEEHWNTISAVAHALPVPPSRRRARRRRAPGPAARRRAPSGVPPAAGSWRGPSRWRRCRTWSECRLTEEGLR